VDHYCSLNCSRTTKAKVSRGDVFVNTECVCNVSHRDVGSRRHVLPRSGLSEWVGLSKVSVVMNRSSSLR
jgi:hypothetical protein